MTEQTKLQKKADIKQKQSLTYLRDKDREKVKGVFHNHECPGAAVQFPLRLHKGDQIETWTFLDGEVREIPLGVAKHLNNTCWYPESKHAVDKDGIPKVMLAKKIRRYSFESLEFVSIPDFDTTNDLVTATPL